MLEVKEISKNFGEFKAIDQLSFNVKIGDVMGFLGPNGAGKTTTLKSISNLLASERGEVTKGSITFNNQDVHQLDPSQLVKMGVIQVMEGRHCFEHLTVEENLRLGAYTNELGKHFETDIKEVYDLFPVLSDRKTQRGGTLSGGEQQMLAIGRALMSKPKVLLLDEPSLGIAPKLVNQIFASIKNINKEKNVTIFLVEQNAKKALELADRAYVLVNGKVTIKGPGQELLKNKDIQAAYLEGGAKN